MYCFHWFPLKLITYTKLISNYRPIPLSYGEWLLIFNRLIKKRLVNKILTTRCIDLVDICLSHFLSVDLRVYLNIVPAGRASTDFNVCSSPRLLIFTSSLVLTHQWGQTLWKHALQHSQNITLHNLNKYKAICHCHVRVAPFCVCLHCLSHPPPYSTTAPTLPPPRPASFAPAQQQEAVMVIVLTPGREPWPSLLFSWR